MRKIDTDLGLLGPRWDDFWDRLSTPTEGKVRARLVGIGAGVIAGIATAVVGWGLLAIPCVLVVLTLVRRWAVASRWYVVWPTTAVFIGAVLLVDAPWR